MKQLIILGLVIILMMSGVSANQIVWTHKVDGCSTLNITPTLFGELKISSHWGNHLFSPYVKIKGHKTVWIDRWYYKGNMYYDFKISNLKEGKFYTLFYSNHPKKMKYLSINVYDFLNLP